VFTAAVAAVAAPRYFIQGGKQASNPMFLEGSLFSRVNYSHLDTAAAESHSDSDRETYRETNTTKSSKSKFNYTQNYPPIYDAAARFVFTQTLHV